MDAFRFELLVPEGVTVTVPVKNFESVSTTIDENKKGSVKRIFLKRIFDQGGETIERFSHIDQRGGHVNWTGKAVKHQVASSR